MGAIDYVVPMVFHDDLEWQEDFRKVGSRFNRNDKYSFVRFRSWGIEDVLIECVRKFMPFVRTIYILLARESQVQDWMVAMASQQTGPRVRIVFHREFMPEWALPTFNSTAIEMFLHKIPGISDRFIYANDDMFPVAPMHPEDFFEGDIPRQRCQLYPFPDKPNIFHLLCRSGLNFVAREFGLRYTDQYMKGAHGMTPVVKETCEYLWSIGGGEIEKSISPFREPKNFTQWIYPWWHHLSGNYIDADPVSTYINVSATVDDVVRRIACCRNIVCINDNECEPDYTKYAVAAKRAIEARLRV